ncbi:MAG: hypothetical protein ACI4D3_07050 [Lachnospiraceae bacterium]
MKKKLCIIEIFLVVFALYSIIMTLIQLGDCQNQVDFSARGNVLNVLNPVGFFSAGRAVLEDSEKNIYVSNLGADTDTIQKFSQEGKYICSYFVNDKERLFWIEYCNLSVELSEEFLVFIDGELMIQRAYADGEKDYLQKTVHEYGSYSGDTDIICVFSANEIILYAKDYLLGEIPLSEMEIEEFATVQLESDGSLFFWTVTMEDGRKIRLEKILNSDICYGGVFSILIDIALILGFVITSDKKRTEKIESPDTLSDS